MTNRTPQASQQGRDNAETNRSKDNEADSFLAFEGREVMERSAWKTEMKSGNKDRIEIEKDRW